MRILLAARNVLERNKFEAVSMLLFNLDFVFIYDPRVHSRRTCELKRKANILNVSYMLLLHLNFPAAADSWFDWKLSYYYALLVQDSRFLYSLFA